MDKKKRNFLIFCIIMLGEAIIVAIINGVISSIFNLILYSIPNTISVFYFLIIIQLLFIVLGWILATYLYYLLLLNLNVFEKLIEVIK